MANSIPQSMSQLIKTGIMSSNHLRDMITINGVTGYSLDAGGGRHNTTGVIYTCWAAIEDKSGSVAMASAGGAISTMIDSIITIRYTTGLTDKMYVVGNESGLIYQIVRTSDVNNRRKWLQLFCKIREVA